MTALHRPEAIQLVGRLEALLEIADSAFPSPGDSAFDESLIKIPNLIGKLQIFLPGSPTRRTPFWKCVVAVNRAKQGLHLIEKLNGMVSRAKAMPPGPFAHVLNVFSRSSKQPASYRALLAELDSYLYRLPHDFGWLPVDPGALHRQVPNDLTHLVPVLKRTLSPQFKQIAGSRTPPANPDALKAWAYHAFFDLLWHNQEWRRKHWANLENFADFVLPLEHDPYTKALKRLLYGPLRTTHQIAMSDLRARQAEASEKLRRKKAAATRPLTQRKRKIPPTG